MFIRSGIKWKNVPIIRRSFRCRFCAPRIIRKNNIVKRYYYTNIYWTNDQVKQFKDNENKNLKNDNQSGKNKEVVKKNEEEINEEEPFIPPHLAKIEIPKERLRLRDGKVINPLSRGRRSYDDEEVYLAPAPAPILPDNAEVVFPPPEMAKKRYDPKVPLSKEQLQMMTDLGRVKNFAIKERGYRDVYLIDEDGSGIGIYPVEEAVRMARMAYKDLVMIKERKIPVCKILNILDYVKNKAKYLPDPIKTKELPISSKITENDLIVKAKKAISLLGEGFPVKFAVYFKVTADRNFALGEAILSNVFDRIKDHVSDKTPNIKRTITEVHLKISPKKTKN